MATQSWNAAEPQIEQKCAVRLRALLQRLADAGKLLSRDACESFGDDIFVIKTHCGFHAYGWLAGKDWVVSHCTYNNNEEFTDSDRNAVLRNRDLYNNGANHHDS